MDYRVFLAAPLAALALTANGADKLRVPDGWLANATYAWPDGATHEAGVAPETEASGQRALTVRALGTRQPNEIGGISQYAMGYAGRRVRFSAQVKTSGVDGWAGLVVALDYSTLAFQPYSPTYVSRPPRGAAGCPDWCEVSVVADIPNDDGSTGVPNVGLALIGSGQAWARQLRLEVVGNDVPVTTEVFAPQAAESAQASVKQKRFLDVLRKTTPKNLALR